MSEKLLGILSAPADDASISGMEWEVSGSGCAPFEDAITYTYGSGDCLNCLWPSIFHLSELFTYLNELFIAVGHKGSKSEDLPSRLSTAHKFSCSLDGFSIFKMTLPLE